MSYLPSKKVAIIALLILVILIGVFWYVGKQNQNVAGNLTYLSPTEAAWLKQQAELRDFIETKLATGNNLIEPKQANFSVVLPTAAEPKLSTITNPTAEQTKQYGLKIAATLKPLTTPLSDPAKLALEALTTKNPKPTIEIANQALLFGAIGAELSRISVPADAVANHLALIAKFNKISQLLGQMAEVLDQPIIALEAGKSYLSELAGLYSALSQMNQYFVAKKIIFPVEQSLQINFSANN